MPFNGSGQYTPPGTDFPAVAGTLIQSVKFNNVINDLASALSICITRDGQQIFTANQNFGGFRLVSVGNAIARSDAPNLGNVQDGGALWAGNAGGSANAITITLTPAITSYAAGQKFRFKATANNSGATTIAVNGLTAMAVQLEGNALAGGEIVSGKIYEILYDGSAFQLAYTFSIGTLTSKTLVTPTVTNPDNTKQTLTDGASIAWNMALGQIAQVTLAGNRAVAAPTNLKKGTYILEVNQDGVGSRTLTWDPVFKWQNGTAPVLSTGVGKKDVFFFYSDGTNLCGNVMLDVR